MSGVTVPPYGANRRDHFTPQGYLRGFIHPERLDSSKPLWVFDVQTRRWSERSPKEIGFEIGYYDYPPDSRPDATAEDAFMRLENDFPRIRERIRREGYATWEKHRDLLVSFACMMAARSPMFRTQAEARVLASLRAKADGSLLAKNYAITLMRAEIETRRRVWQTWSWGLGFTADAADPVITSDQAVGMRCNRRDQADAFADGDFWIWCPLSWDMCLIGSSELLTEKRATALEPHHLAEIRSLTRAQSRRFLVSPVRVKDLEV